MSYSHPLDHLVVSVSVGRTFGDRPAVRVEVGRRAVELFVLRPRWGRPRRLSGPGRYSTTYYGPVGGITVESG